MCFLTALPFQGVGEPTFSFVSLRAKRKLVPTALVSDRDSQSVEPRPTPHLAAGYLWEFSGPAHPT